MSDFSFLKDYVDQKGNEVSEDLLEVLKSNEEYAKNVPGSIKVLIVADSSEIVDGISHGLDRNFEDIVVTGGVTAPKLYNEIYELAKNLNSSVILYSGIDKDDTSNSWSINCVKLHIDLKKSKNLARILFQKNRKKLPTLQNAISFVIEGMVANNIELYESIKIASLNYDKLLSEVLNMKGNK